MLADYHIHSEFSDDSDYPMETIVQDAINIGLDEICFTDHVDYGIKDDRGSGREIRYSGGYPCLNVDYPRYFKKFARVKALYSDRIAVKAGLECGVQSHTIPQFNALFERYEMDFALLSIHQVDDMEFWTGDFQRGKTQREYNERYYGEMLKVVRSYTNYSVLAHMDLIVRHEEHGAYPFELLEPFIREILKVVISGGKGIELNTSYRRYGLSGSMPSVDILKLYRELGGEIITIGSDTHQPAHLGAYISEGMELLKSLGFKRFCTYEKMKPIFHEL
ncbi:MAG: histidinol-phosphatase HisJ family protein [Oscillospiraceae bacterium]|nr:histidinol-phosphatase HisJ family protein [Oscillospiraceae bacterium]